MRDVLLNDRKRITMSRNYFALMFLSILCLFVVSVSIAGPKLQCDQPKYDFGTVIGRDSITNERRVVFDIVGLKRAAKGPRPKLQHRGIDIDFAGIQFLAE